MRGLAEADYRLYIAFVSSSIPSTPVTSAALELGIQSLLQSLSLPNPTTELFMGMYTRCSEETSLSVVDVEHSDVESAYQSNIHLLEGVQQLA